MSFWLHESKGISCLRSYSRLKKMGLTLGLFSFFISTWTYFFYLPSTQQQDFLKTKHASAQQKNNFLQDRVCLFDVIKTQKRESAALAQQALLRYGNKYNGSDLFANGLFTHKLVCTQIEPTGRKQHDSILKDYIRIQARGTYHDMISFLEKLDNYTYFIKFCSFTCQRLKKRKVTCDMSVRFARLIKGGVFEDSHVSAGFFVRE